MKDKDRIYCRMLNFEFAFCVSPVANFAEDFEDSHRYKLG
jgi:hypothetical protein